MAKRLLEHLKTCIVPAVKAGTFNPREPCPELEKLIREVPVLDLIPLGPASLPWDKGIIVQYIHLESAFAVGLFCLAKDAIIPMHDHPGMRVLSKVCSGTVEVEKGNGTKAICKEGELLTIWPDDNYHAFRGVENVVMLDILTPHYSAERKCTYYQRLEDGTLVPTVPSYSTLSMEYSGVV